METNAQMGWIAHVTVGVVGSILGYLITGLLGFAAVGGIVRFFVAFGGAALLIFILGKLGIFLKKQSQTRRTPCLATKRRVVITRCIGCQLPHPQPKPQKNGHGSLVRAEIGCDRHTFRRQLRQPVVPFAHFMFSIPELNPQLWGIFFRGKVRCFPNLP